MEWDLVLHFLFVSFFDRLMPLPIFASIRICWVFFFILLRQTALSPDGDVRDVRSSPSRFESGSTPTLFSELVFSLNPGERFLKDQSETGAVVVSFFFLQ